MVPGLIPGSYRVEVAVSGFKIDSAGAGEYFYGDRQRLWISSWRWAKSTQTVDVQVSAPLLQATNSEVSAEIEERTLFDLPLQLSNSGSSGTTGGDRWIRLSF